MRNVVKVRELVRMMTETEAKTILCVPLKIGQGYFTWKLKED